MTTFTLQQRARAAARYAERRCKVHLDPEDFADTEMAAAEGWLRAQRRRPGDQHQGYAVISARNAALKCILREIWGRNPLWSLHLDALDAGDERAIWPVITGSREGLPGDILRELYHILLDARAKKGARGALAAGRDLFILSALCREWTNEGIAQALGVPPNSIRKYRARLISVLALEAERRNFSGKANL